MMYILAYLLLGAFAGVMGGMLGIGGGVIIVPVLIALFTWQAFPAEVITVMAVASSLASIIFTSLSAMRAQMKRDAVDWVIFRQWSVVVVLGGFCSGFIAQYLPALAMKQGIAVFLLIVSIIMLSQWVPKPERQLPGPVGTGIIGFICGVASALAGIAGGNIIVPTLVFFNVQMQRAAATASSLGLPIATVGTLGYVIAGLDATARPEWSLGYVYLPAALSVAVMTYLMAPLGVAIAHKLPAKTLKRVFGGLLFFVASSMLWSTLA
ncbi:sulfite exporter TauE/SafE family protein [Allohahella marinimesophila]|uniref:Probable membrane transporter protein n=1 Tax=Allohahella marinimesophila TaxID=1054972 RepID=A0ABP7NWQ7_9GAMM